MNLLHLFSQFFLCCVIMTCLVSAVDTGTHNSSKIFLLCQFVSTKRQNLQVAMRLKCPRLAPLVLNKWSFTKICTFRKLTLLKAMRKSDQAIWLRLQDCTKGNWKTKGRQNKAKQRMPRWKALQRVWRTILSSLNVTKQFSRRVVRLRRTMEQLLLSRPEELFFVL